MHLTVVLLTMLVLPAVSVLIERCTGEGAALLFAFLAATFPAWRR